MSNYRLVEILKIPDLIAPDNLNHQYSTEPHTINFYRNIICIYLSLMSLIIKFGTETQIKNMNCKTKSNGKTINYELVHSLKHFVKGSVPDSKILIFKKNKKEFIVYFDTGYRMEITQLSEDNIDIDRLVDFLEYITILKINNVKRILLCGHSHGMSIATLTSIILLSLQKKEFYNYCNTLNYFSKTCNIIFDYKYKKTDTTSHDLFNYDRVQFSVCGTGGFPLLFKSQEEFNTYFNYIEGRYLHVGISTSDKRVDAYMSPIVNHKNYRFHIYSADRKNSFTPCIDLDTITYQGLNNLYTQFIEDEAELMVYHQFMNYKMLLTLFFCTE